MSVNRIPFGKVGGLQVFKVKLIGGPCDGMNSICSHDTVYQDGYKYTRGKDDLYYYVPHENVKYPKN